MNRTRGAVHAGLACGKGLPCYLAHEAADDWDARLVSADSSMKGRHFVTVNARSSHECLFAVLRDSHEGAD